MRTKVFLALLMLTLFASAGVYMQWTARADPSDFCSGYAICK